jgi:hypothetical protein
MNISIKELDKLIFWILNRVTISIEVLDELDEELRRDYNIWSDYDYLPTDQIIQNPKKEQVIQRLLQFKLLYS